MVQKGLFLVTRPNSHPPKPPRLGGGVQPFTQMQQIQGLADRQVHRQLAVDFGGGGLVTLYYPRLNLAKSWFVGFIARDAHTGLLTCSSKMQAIKLVVILSIHRRQKILPIFPLPKYSSQNKKSIREKSGLSHTARPG
jgi:hypothetical protein